MKTNEMHLKMQACLDGEADARTQKEVAAWLAQDAESQAIERELRWTRAAARGNELSPALPESGEFYWSKIQRAIAAQAEPVAPVRRPWWSRWQVRVVVPLGIAAALFLVFTPQGRKLWSHGPVQTAETQSSTYNLYTEEGNVTVIWVGNVGN